MVSNQTLLNPPVSLATWRSQQATVNAQFNETRRWVESMAAPATAPSAPPSAAWCETLRTRVQALSESLRQYYDHANQLLAGLDSGLWCAELEAVQQMASSDQEHFSAELEQLAQIAAGPINAPVNGPHVLAKLDWILDEFDQHSEREADRLEWLLASCGCE